MLNLLFKKNQRPSLICFNINIKKNVFKRTDFKPGIYLIHPGFLFYYFKNMKFN